jgi:hypothetical protein
METPSNTSSSVVAHSQQLIGPHFNPNPIPQLPADAQSLRRMSQHIAPQRQQISQLLQHQLFQFQHDLLRTRSHLLRSNTMPSDVRNMPTADLLRNLQGQSSNPIHGSVATGQNPPSTHSQSSQIAGLSGQPHRPYMRQRSDISNSSSQRHGSGHAGTSLHQPPKIGNISGHQLRQHSPHHSDMTHLLLSGQQIQPTAGGMPHPQAPSQFGIQSQREQQGFPYASGGSGLHLRPPGSSNLPSSSNKVNFIKFELKNYYIF